jgi:hypothetical protein
MGGGTGKEVNKLESEEHVSAESEVKKVFGFFVGVCV